MKTAVFFAFMLVSVVYLVYEVVHHSRLGTLHTAAPHWSWLRKVPQPARGVAAYAVLVVYAASVAALLYSEVAVKH